MMSTYMSTMPQLACSQYTETESVEHLPLKIIRPWILVVSIGTIGTYVAWATMNQTMPDHLILSLEAFTAFATRTAFFVTVVWTV